MKVQKNTFIYMLLLSALLAFALAFLPFASTIIVAAIFALGITYWLDNIYIEFPRSKKIVVVISIFLSLSLLVGTAIIATARLYNLTVGEDRQKTFATIQLNKKNVFEKIESTRLALKDKGIKIPPIREDTLIDDWTQFAQSSFMSKLTKMGGYLSALTDSVVNILVFIVFVVVMVRRRQKIIIVLSDTSLWGDLRLRSIYFKAQESGYGSIFTIFSAGLVQTIVMTIGARIASFNELSIIFTTTFFASFFPVIGTAPVGVFLAAVKFFQGDNTAGIIMVCFAGFVGVVDNWLKPFLVSHSGPKMNGLITLVGIIGAIMIFGLPGLFVGPFLMILIPSLKSEASDLLRSLTKARKATPLVLEDKPQFESSHFN
jgi:predicted PurR-regulated permease PerM